MTTEYFQYNDSNLEEKVKDDIHSCLNSIVGKFNQNDDERVHLDGLKWSYFDRSFNSEEQESVICQAVGAIESEYDTALLETYDQEEIDFFRGNDIDLIFFKEGLDVNYFILVHEVWHTIEAKNDILRDPLLEEGTATYASLWYKEQTGLIVNPVNDFLSNTQKMIKKGEEENQGIVPKSVILYSIPFLVVFNYCNSLQDLLDNEKREKAINTLDKYYVRLFVNKS